MIGGSGAAAGSLQANATPPQQLIAFNSFYGEWMYHPLVIHAGITGCILGTFLRPGDAQSAESTLSALRPIVRRLKEEKHLSLAATYRMRTRPGKLERATGHSKTVSSGYRPTSCNQTVTEVE